MANVVTVNNLFLFKRKSVISYHWSWWESSEKFLATPHLKMVQQTWMIFAPMCEVLYQLDSFRGIFWFSHQVGRIVPVNDGNMAAKYYIWPYLRIRVLIQEKALNDSGTSDLEVMYRWWTHFMRLCRNEALQELTMQYLTSFAFIWKLKLRIAF